ncbi:MULTISPECIES: stage V sporulation protein D [Clostridia]|uniref:Stage V sporulation protein D n=2 Tax=Clostridia TaxID=186801 RepID=A0A8I0AEF7_9CLOT|nr:MULTISPECIES: stage V sporulation protein D [unclassified Clostridium]MBC5640265.1 stage V sporulation protein D [Clostridium lentum]MBC5654483.1 stage V sporulation protein D [Blautia lenta]MEE0567625.1 stage V sporulation protein D [Clostridium sp.]OKZ85084.1 MAG: stage V sporulation protein D [Clostridium sp. 29_15]CDB75597.1 stage V sporulation protein D [Clostridium sp. CAG:265]
MKKKKFKDRALIQKRLTLVVWTIVVVFFILILRLSYIMIVKRDEYSSRAEEQWTSEVSIDARRGRILDRNGVELAVSANVYRVDFDLNSVRQYLKNNSLTNADIAGKIADAVGMEENKVMEKLETKLASGANAGSATLIRRIEKESADKVNNLNIDGVIVSPDTKRYYPKGEFLAHVLGSTNVDGQGLTGVELQYNEYLSGVPGVRISEIERNEENLSYTISNFTEPIDGKDVTLTTDSKIQAIAEKVAEKGLVDNQAKRVSIMVMNPNNGEILAMVNKPDFDPNNAFDGFEDFSGETDGEKLQKMWRNSLVNDTFEPGSIFKVVTMVTALEEGIASESDTFECGGSLQVGSHTIKCWKTSGHGSQILPQILQNSCNVGFMKLGEKIGKETLNEYIKKLGFGKTTGIDLPGEASGIVKKTESITESDLATISFGQTNTVTAIQYMQAFNALANGGSLIQPHILKEVSHYDNTGTKIVDETFEPVISKNVLSAKSTATLRDYLERTVNEGGSNKSYIEGYHIGGKTGTAQKVNSVTGGYESGKYISSMAAMAPIDSPEITAFISIDEPSNGAYYAGVVTAPLMKILLTDIFNYMDSEFSEDYNAVARDILIPEIRGKSIEEAKKILKDVNLEYNIEGSGESVTNTQPYPGYTVKEGTKITIYTGDAVDNNKVSMPDLTGFSVTSAEDVLDNLGIKYILEGDGFVIDQSIPAGEVITTGSNVRLTLSDDYGD